MTLAATLAAIQARASYITCDSGWSVAEGWLPCASLIDDPAALRAQIDATADGRGTTDAQVLTSVFVQSYAFRVASVAVAAHALGLPGPSVLPEHTAVRITRNRPGQLAVTADAETADVGVDALAADLLERHMRPFIDAVRATGRIGERMLWGNTAASIATVFRAVHDGDPAVRDRADAFDRAAAPWLGGHGAYDLIDTPVATGWFWNRTNCCLWYRHAGGWCDDCSLPDPGDRDARRVAELIIGGARQ